MQDALDSNNAKIISLMKMIYFLSFNSMPLSSFPHIIKFRRYMEMPSMSAIDDYGTYIYAISRREFLLAIASVLEDKMIEEVTTSTFFSIMVDKFIDRALELHLITHVTYLKNDGIGQSKIKFLNLTGIQDDIATSIFEAWHNLWTFLKVKRSISNTPYKWCIHIYCIIKHCLMQLSLVVIASSTGER